jgi:amino acid adenylation domain-containing protein
MQERGLIQPQNGISSGREDSALVVAMSLAQQRLWFLECLQPGAAVYNMSTAYRLHGVLEIEALRRAVAALVARHESLRTTFATEKGEPVQLIWPSLEVPVVVETPVAGEGERWVERWAKALAGEPFDLERGPLLRVRLLRVSDTEHVLVVVIHHIVSDGWSLGVLWRELAELYAGYARGAVPALPELPIQYADYALWQRERLSGAVLERELGYWRERLAGFVPLELPTDRARPAVQSYRGGVERFELGEALTRSLKELARAQGVTLYMVLLAAFASLLGRYGGQDDVVLGSAIAGRNRRELEGLIGFFVNTLVLRVDLSGEPTFRDLLGRVWEVALGAYEHQELPFEKLVEELAPERDLSRNPLVQVLLVLQNAPGSRLALPGLQVESVPLESDAAKFDLAVSLREVDSRLEGSVSYARDLFDAATIERLAGHFCRLIEDAATHPDRRVWELELLGESERKRMLEDWSGVTREYPRAAGLAELFEAQVARAPEAVAVVWGGEKLSYGELNVRANRLAHALVAEGVGPDVPVGLCVERSTLLVEAMLGVVKAGGAYVPLDPAYPAERLGFMLADAAPPVVVTQARHRALFKVYGGRVLCLDDDPCQGQAASGQDMAPRAGGEQLAYIMYTSGSTGTPKGVAIPQRAVSRLVLETDYVQLSAADAVAQASNVNFDAATFEVWGALLNGARLVVIDWDMLLSPARLSEALAEHGVTTLFLTTALFNQLVERSGSYFRGVKQVLFGGEAADVRLVQRVLAEGPPGRLLNMYGPTECTTFATWYALPARLTEEPSVPIGRPIANTQAFVLDGHRQLVPLGVPGELCLAGDGLARGYWARPELSAERFVPNPFSPDPGDRLYRTGDRVRWRTDGLLEFLGRLDGQVKLRGFRIELGEVEANLTAAPGVRQAAVVLREDRPGQMRLVGYLVYESGAAQTDYDLEGFLRRRLPGYMVPSAFVPLRRLPLTANGKLDRHALPAPEEVGAKGPKVSGGLRGVIEVQLVRLWEDLLGVWPVSATDNFFALGGTSLLAVRLIDRIEQIFGRTLPVNVIWYGGSTIRELARLVVESSDEPVWGRPVAIRSRGSLPPLFCLPIAGGHLFHYDTLSRYLDAERPVYGLPPRGIDGKRPVHTSIEDMAAYAIELMREIQPGGPYHLAGYCSGGVVAFEMARQLEASGDRVGMLALIDSTAPHAANVPRLLLNIAAQRTDWRLSQERLYATLLGGLGLPRLRRLNGVGESHRWALWTYKPRPLRGRITLFRPADPEVVGGSTLGWGRLARGGVDVNVLEGRHTELLKEPRVRELARRLNVCLAGTSAG